MEIYKITNNLNGKGYVGQTTLTAKKRFLQHLREAKKEKPKTLISRAIKKYGEENFCIELLETAKTLEELSEKEKKWILLENTMKPNGYNVLLGHCAIRERIYEFECFELDYLGITLKIRSQKLFEERSKEKYKTKKDLEKGFLASNGKYYKKTNDFTEKEKKKLERIIHYDSNFEILGIYKSRMEMQRETNNKYWNSLISRCILKKDSVFSDNTFVVSTLQKNIKEIREHKKKIIERGYYQEKKVRQFTIDGEYIRTFKNLKEAGDAIGCVNGGEIIQVCKKERAQARGFVWVYEDEI